MSFKKRGEICAVNTTAVGFSSKDEYNCRDKFPTNAYRLVASTFLHDRARGVKDYKRERINVPFDVSLHGNCIGN